MRFANRGLSSVNADALRMFCWGYHMASKTKRAWNRKNRPRGGIEGEVSEVRANREPLAADGRVFPVERPFRFADVYGWLSNVESIRESHGKQNMIDSQSLHAVLFFFRINQSAKRTFDTLFAGKSQQNSTKN